MQAVILAAGEGRRLRPLTDNVPKPMVRILGKPILEYTLSMLPKEIDEVILVVGYKGQVVKDYFGSLYKHFALRYVLQETPMGTGHALELTKPFLKKGDFLFLYADDLYSREDIEECVRSAHQMVLVKEVVHPERFGVCTLGKDNRILDIVEKPENPTSNLALVGVHKLSIDLFKIPKVQLPNGEYNLTGQIANFSHTTPIYALRARFWHPIGYPEDVVEAGRLLLKN